MDWATQAPHVSLDFIVQLYLLISNCLNILSTTEDGVEISNCSCTIVSPFNSQCLPHSLELCWVWNLLVSRNSGFKSVLFGITMATSAISWLLVTGNRFLYFLTFKLFLSSDFKWVSCTEYIVFLKSMFQSVLSSEFNPFTFEMITDKGRACVCHFDVCFLYAF